MLLKMLLFRVLWAGALMSQWAWFNYRDCGLENNKKLYIQQISLQFPEKTLVFWDFVGGPKT